MEWRTSLRTFVLTVILVVVSCDTESLIIPPDYSDPFVPICTSYSGLCHLAYNVSQPRGEVLHSHGQVCRCPNHRRCPIQWDNMENSLIKVFPVGGREIEVKISYCQLEQPSTLCAFNSPAVVLRGDGLFNFEIFGDFRCKCNRRLYAHRSWRWGDYVYTEYSCGKPRCIMNHTDNTCMRMTYQPSQRNVMVEYRCRCRWFEKCEESRPPTAGNPTVMQTCQRV